MIDNVKSFFLYGNNLESILFKNAVSFAEDGKKVWFISPEPITQLPANITVIDKEVLKLLTFLYLKDVPELLKQLNSIHMWYRTPELIILNNFHIYKDSDNINSVKQAFICANLLDACLTCSKKLGKPTNLLVAYNIDPPSDQIFQNIVDLYFDDVIKSTELPSDYIIKNIL